MKIIHRLAMTAAALSAVGGAGLLSLATAGPASADTATWAIDYHTAGGLVQDGTATVIRTGNTVEVKINMLSGSTFGSTTPNLQICASTVAFTARVSGNSGCTGSTNGEWFSYTESGAAADVTFTLGSAFTNTAGYLQIHVNSDDNGTANTSMANPPNDDPSIFGNVPTDPLPIAAIGAVGLAGGLGGILYLMQRRRRPAAVTA